MFKKKQQLPTPKPDPPLTTKRLLVMLITVTSTGFCLTVTQLKAINATLRHEPLPEATETPKLPVYQFLP